MHKAESTAPFFPTIYCIGFGWGGFRCRLNSIERQPWRRSLTGSSMAMDEAMFLIESTCQNSKRHSCVCVCVQSNVTDISCYDWSFREPALNALNYRFCHVFLWFFGNLVSSRPKQTQGPLPLPIRLSYLRWIHKVGVHPRHRWEAVKDEVSKHGEDILNSQRYLEDPRDSSKLKIRIILLPTMVALEAVSQSLGLLPSTSTMTSWLDLATDVPTKYACFQGLRLRKESVAESTWSENLFCEEHCN